MKKWEMGRGAKTSDEERVDKRELAFGKKGEWRRPINSIILLESKTHFIKHWDEERKK